MKVLLLNGTKKSTKAYEKRLKKLGVEFEEATASFKDASWLTGYPTPAYLSVLADAIEAEHGATVDVLQLLIDPKDWGGRLNLRGTHFGSTHAGYEVCIVKYRKKWEDTAEHELMHCVDNMTRRYLGIDLERIVQVRDWDDDVVHGEDKRFKEYEYDSVWKSVKSLVLQSALIRRLRALISTKL